LGADTVRLYLAFIGPYNEPGHYPWNPDGVVGVRRFLERVWRLQDKVTADGQVTETTERELHKAIKKVTDDALQLKFNTAISAMMTFVNVAEKEGITAPQYTTLLQLLAPFAPHITEELWALLGNSTSIHTQKWPQHDQSKLVQDTLTLGISVNGKRRGEVSVSAHATETEVIQAAQAAVAKWLEGGYKKAIVVQGRVVNFVV
jgi:leucyl-tRNA synthetase